MTQYIQYVYQDENFTYREKDDKIYNICTF